MTLSRIEAIDFLSKVDKKKNAAPLKRINDRDAHKHDEWPASVDEAYTRLCHSTEDTDSVTHPPKSNDGGEKQKAKVLFTKCKGKGKPNNNKGNNNNGVKCAYCGKSGHPDEKCFEANKAVEMFKKHPELKAKVMMCFAYSKQSCDCNVLSSNDYNYSLGTSLINTFLGTYNELHSFLPAKEVPVSSDLSNSFISPFNNVCVCDSTNSTTHRVCDNFYTCISDDHVSSFMTLKKSRSDKFSPDDIRQFFNSWERHENVSSEGDVIDKSANVVDRIEDSHISNAISCLAKQRKCRGDIYMDSGSQCNLTPFKEMLTNLRPADHPLTIHGVNGGTSVANEVGNIGPLVFYVCTDSPVCILSLDKCSEFFRVCFDSANRRGFEVITKEGICRFVPTRGCYVFNVDDTRYSVSDQTIALPAIAKPTVTFSQSSPTVINVQSDEATHDNDVEQANDSLMESHSAIDELTVHNYKDKLSRVEVKRMKAVETIFHALGQPGLADFRKILMRQPVEHDSLSVTARDWDNYLKVFGVPPTVVKGRMVRQSPPKIDTIDLLIKHADYELTLHGDLMFISSLVFFITISDGMDYIMVIPIDSKDRHDVETGLHHTCRNYSNQGYKAVELFFDGESAMKNILRGESRETKLFDCAVKQSNPGDHVPKAERAIRTIKERVRCIGLTLMYKVNATVLTHLVYHAVNCINIMPKKQKLLAPFELFTGRRVQYNLLTAAKFGDLYMIPLANSKTNEMKARACSAICLGAVLDLANPGTFSFYTLHSRKVMHRTQFVHQVMHEAIVERMNVIAGTFKQDFISKDSEFDRLPLDDSSSEDDDDTQTHRQPVVPRADTATPIGEEHQEQWCLQKKS